MHGTAVPQAFPSADGPPGPDLGELIAQVRAETTHGLATVEWAKDEIAEAIKRHPEAKNDLFHAFRLLVPAIVSPAWSTEFVYRGHARELLERVVKGADTRPGTAAECCLAMSAVSNAMPLHGAVSGFYFRMWRQAFPANEVWPEGADHHEALYSGQIDDHERYVRHKLSQPSRRLAPSAIDCGGVHWGEPVTCKYATADGERVAS